MKHFVAKMNTMEYSELAVLSDSQSEKLTCSKLSNHIDGLAKGLHVEWEVVIRDNAELLMLTRKAKRVEDAELHDLEMAMNNFLSSVDKMELPKCPAQESSDQEKIEKEVKEVINTLLSDEEFEDNRFPIMRKLNDNIMIGLGGIPNPVMRHILTLAKKAYDK